MERVRVIPVSRENRALRSLRKAGNGSEWGVLEALAQAVISGKKVDPFFQSVVNAIVAKAVISGKLPAKKKGRPAVDQFDSIGWDVAFQYFALKDGGVSYDDAVAQVANKFHKDERTVMRLVKANKAFIGVTLAARERTRFRENMHAQALNELAAGVSIEYTFHILSDPEEIDRIKSCSIGEIDVFIGKLLEQGDSADTK